MIAHIAIRLIDGGSQVNGVLHGRITLRAEGLSQNSLSCTAVQLVLLLEECASCYVLVVLSSSAEKSLRLYIIRSNFSMLR